MGEQTPSPGNEEYLQQHPDAIVDKAKAEIMARASKPYEDRLVRDRDAALHNVIEGNQSGAQEAVRDARDSRSRADQYAENAANVYDSTKDL